MAMQERKRQVAAKDGGPSKVEACGKARVQLSGPSRPAPQKNILESVSEQRFHPAPSSTPATAHPLDRNAPWLCIASLAPIRLLLVPRFFPGVAGVPPRPPRRPWPLAIMTPPRPVSRLPHHTPPRTWSLEHG